MPMKSICKACLCLIIFVSGLCARAADNSYMFRHLGTENGLSNSHVNAFLRDSEGFLWVGTELGLNRYDGYNFRTYKSERNNIGSLLVNDIRSLQEDGAGNIWVWASWVYVVYDRAKDNFRQDAAGVLRQLGIRADGLFRVYVDRRKRLWVIKHDEVDCYDYRTGHHVSVPLSGDYREEDVMGWSMSDDGRSLYLCAGRGNLFSIDADAGCLVSRVELPDVEYEVQERASADHYTSYVYVDLSGGLWLYADADDRLYYREKAARGQWRLVALEAESPSSSNYVTSVMDVGNGHVWVSTDHNGVFVYDYVNDKMQHLTYSALSPTSLASDRIMSLYRDDTGVVWVGHFKNGVSYCHESFHEFISNKCPECGDVISLLEDSHGNIWLGTDGTGLYMRDADRDMAVRKIDVPDMAITSLLEDNRGRVWAATFKDGLYCVGHDGRVRHYTESNSDLPFDEIWVMKLDRNGFIWAGSAFGTLVCINPETMEARRFRMPDGGSVCVLALGYDGSDKIYAGTPIGVCSFDIVTGKSELFRSNRSGTQPFPRLHTSQVYSDSRNLLWIGHDGLAVWDMAYDEIYEISDRLCDNSIKSMCEDNNGRLWVGTGNGLAVVSVGGTEKKRTFSVVNFSTKDGLRENCFNRHSSTRLKNGDVLIGGTKGYTEVNPNKLTYKNKQAQQVRFTGLLMGNRRIEVDSVYAGRVILPKALEYVETLVLAYDDNLISIEFTASDLLNPGNMSYEFKIEGLNDNWNPTDGNRVSLSNLLPGKYELKVRARSGEGEWNESPDGLRIVVAPPSYLSASAVSLYLLVLVAVVLLIIYLVRRHMAARKLRAMRKLEQEQQQRLNEMKLKFFTNIGHDLRTPLTLILSPLQMLMKEIDDTTDPKSRKKLEVINKNANNLLELINQLLDFRKLDMGGEALDRRSGDMVSFAQEVCAPFKEYASDRRIRFTTISECDECHTMFDPSKIRKVLVNLLSNAFKYTPDGGEIAVHVYRSDDSVNVSVADSGPGVSDTDKKLIFERFYQAKQSGDKTGNGIGLHIVSEYVQMHGGSVCVNDNYPTGAVFTVSLPLVAGEPDASDAREAEAPAPSVADRKVLLVVDDNVDFCDFMAETFSDEYTVEKAHNGLEALSVLAEKPVDLVVSDVMMPEMNGNELCRRIKTTMEWSHIPVILLTARSAEECRREGYELGADDYIVKPFDIDILRLRVRKFMEWTERSHKAFSQKIEIKPGDITITSLDEVFIDKAIKLVEERMSDPDFSVEVLGSELGLSRSHLYKKLMAITGRGPADFIRVLRLKRGKQLLENSRMQISEIAYEVGFGSPKRFTINFKQEFGTSPSDYLRKHRESN